MTTKATAAPIVKVKTEPASDEIKEFAETAMNELLGWYGYENVDRSELVARCASRMSQTIAASINHNHPHLQSHSRQQQRATSPLVVGQHSCIAPGNGSSSSAIITRSNGHWNQQQQHLPAALLSNIAALAAAAVAATAHPNAERPTQSAESSGHTMLLGEGRPTTPVGNHSGRSRSSSRSSRSSSTAHSKPMPSASADRLRRSASEEKKDDECGWCKRTVLLSAPEMIATPDGPRYCNESCFSQSRRASFKRARTCDWCKHVRHAVSYVDFQDGASQLQFCSDKCLNQYKMQIFCRETQAHLDQNPHLKNAGNGSDDGSLITPDLWMRNCKSRSASPTSDRSRSRSHSPPSTPSIASSTAPPQTPISMTAPRPVITLAPSSKLLFRPDADPSSSNESNASQAHSRTAIANPPLRISPRVTRKRRSMRVVCSANSVAVNDRTPPAAGLLMTCGNTPTLQDLTTKAQHRNIAAHLLSAASAAKEKQTAAAGGPSHSSGINCQDSAMRTPMNYHHPSSPASTQQFVLASPGSSHSASASMQFVARPPIASQSTFAGHALNRQQLSPDSVRFPVAAGQPKLPAFMHQSTHRSGNPNVSPQFPEAIEPNASHTQWTPPSLASAQPGSNPAVIGSDSSTSALRAFGSAAPPITILVPYPVLVPVPIPIPIPMPIVAFLRAAQSKLDAENNNHSNACNGNSVSSDEQPLDFTTSRDLCAEDDPEQLIEVICEDASPEHSDNEATRQSACAAAAAKTAEAVAVQEPLPKFKITRLNSRRGFITSSINDMANLAPVQSSPNQSADAISGQSISGEANVCASSTPNETTRPLRKRKRIVDCDFGRSKDDDKRRNQPNVGK